jgi:hypothetical protein
MRKRCAATVWKRDTYRRTGRGRSGYEMHYSRKQCSRVAVANGRCKQHADKTVFKSESAYIDYVDD